jgi:D-3-phosphoglycerate dehydrogenase / 2-oxoglutarate reductase
VNDTVGNLILDLLEWVGRKERTYQETMDAWRTSCPRLPVWEDANDRGLVETASANGISRVRLTPAGLALLKEQRPHSYAELLAVHQQKSRGEKESRPPSD